MLFSLNTLQDKRAWRKFQDNIKYKSLIFKKLSIYAKGFKGIKKEYEGGTAEITDVFSAFDITIPCLLNYAVANLIIIAGVICCIIPGILLSPLMNLSIFFLVKGETQGLNALKRSWETLKKNPILILWNIVLGLFAALGLLACCVGILATAPISMCAMYKLFQQAIGEDNLPPVEPVSYTHLTLPTNREV